MYKCYLLGVHFVAPMPRVAAPDHPGRGQTTTSKRRKVAVTPLAPNAENGAEDPLTQTRNLLGE
jgi:hypothetical protein